MDNSTKKILIIEDDQFLREFYQELLQSEGFSVDVAPDGEVGFQKAHAGGFNLILLDLMLPKKDGLQILRDLKVSPPQNQNGPIVVLTNLGQDAIINQCLSMGAIGYLIKSAMNPDQVLTEVHSYLGQH
ncbi:MAG: winged helix family two component transcriptional regulator [Microgenomates group bacterium Gr01-1014_93]|nr:MAG: winged helix family two component transcriptional regulator [Microgenomates group bacterium Gr01-1014_93]